MDVLLKILTDDFSLDELEVLIWHLWHQDVEMIARRGARALVAKEIVAWAERRSERGKLAAAVRNARPNDPRTLDLADEYLETPFRVPHGQLQDELYKFVPAFNPVPWFARALETATKVCAIECEVSPTSVRRGTGCLIAKDLVLTANHVVAGIDDPSKIHILFDYTRTREGQPADEGVEYPPAKEKWIVSSRPQSALDETPVEGQLPALSELDYAVIRLENPAGEHSAGADEVVEGVPKRGWLTLRATAGKLPAESPLLIYHHPKHESLKLSMDMRSIVGLNGNGTRLHHVTNTKGGSSGAPCFDASWNLVAMHQSAQSADDGDYNQAIPIERIAAELNAEHVA